WGESGFAFTTFADFQSRWAASFWAASLAPAKLGIRPSAPGKRETPSRSMARQTARRTWSLERIPRKHNLRPGGTPQGCENDAPMSDEHRTSIGGPVPEDVAAQHPERRSADAMRELLP